MQLIKNYAFPIFFFVNVLASELFGCYLVTNSIEVKSGVLQQFFIIIAVVSYVIAIKDLTNANTKKETIRLLSVMLIFIILMSLTQFFYDNIPYDYIASILYFGSICTASAITGAHLAQRLSFIYIDRIIPFFVIPVGLIIGTMGYFNAMINGIVQTESGLDYQNVAYYCAEIVAYSGYYLLFSSAKGSNSYKFLMYPVIVVLLLCVAVCFMSGGRGGVVLLFVEFFAFLYVLNYAKVINKSRLFLFIVISIIVFLYIAAKINIWDSQGFARVSETIGTDDTRMELQNKSWNIFIDSHFMGKGLGSIWMNLGIYSHNIFLDVLAEIGVVGLIFVLRYIVKIFCRLIVFSKINRGYFLILLIFLKGFTLTLFSGYWLNTYQLWLAFGFVYAIKKVSPINYLICK